MELEKLSWNEETYQEFLACLVSLRDPEYLVFHKNLVPGVENLIGIRLPRLREIAGKISRGNWADYLKLTGNTWYEEVMVEGLVIASLKKKEGIAKILEETDRFLPKINNWAVCDTFCSSLKVMRSFRKEGYEYIETLLQSREEFTLRTGLILLLSHYVEEDYIDDILSHCDRVPAGAYYVSMAVAWLLSCCFVKFREKTWKFLQDNHLDRETYRRTLQKIVESNRVEPEEKEKIRELRRQIGRE